MGRALRYDYPGCIHHIMNRGNHGQRIFREPEDYKMYLNSLAYYYKEYGYSILSYCLMPNHIHILLQTGEMHLSNVMKSVNSRFSNCWNKKYKERGHIFQSRFKSILVQDNEYLLVVSRYIHRNPLKAGMVKCPESYRWNSLKMTVRGGKPDWLRDKIILNLFSKDIRIARTEYLSYVLTPQKEDEKKGYPIKLWKNTVAGTKEYFERTLKILKKDKRETISSEIGKVRIWSLSDIKEKIKAHYGFKYEDIIGNSKERKKSECRRIAIYCMKCRCYYTTKQIRKELGVKKQTVSRAFNEVKNLINKNKLKPEWKAFLEVK